MSTELVRPLEDRPDYLHLLLFAQAEQRTRTELAEVDAVVADLTLAQVAEAVLEPWQSYARQLNRRLTEQVQNTEVAANRMLGHDLPEASVLIATARAACEVSPRERRRLKARTTGAHEAPCPVRGCCLKVKHADQSTTHEPKLLPINPAMVDRPYRCPCGRATLTVGRTLQKRWLLREWTPDRHAREEINLIAHALVTGQAYQDQRHHRAVDTSADETSARMEQAFMTSRAHDRQMRRALLAGHIQLALEYGEQAEAADYAYSLHARTYRKNRRQDVYSGRWHNTERFWLDLPVPLPKTDQGNPQPPMLQRFTFNLLALYSEKGGCLEVQNGDDIERASGTEVGPGGWQQLMDLLGRIDPEIDEPGKPGMRPDLRELIYFDDRGTLALRKYVAQRYPLALVALEALRRTLVPDQRQQRKKEEQDHSEVNGAYGSPAWLGELPE